MSRFARLSPTKIIVGASLWPLGWIAVIVGTLVYSTWEARHTSNLAAFGFGVSNWWLLTAVLFGPPAVLLLAWTLARRRESRLQPPEDGFEGS
jgi:hypothetical protein